MPPMRVHASTHELRLLAHTPRHLVAMPRTMVSRTSSNTSMKALHMPTRSAAERESTRSEWCETRQKHAGVMAASVVSARPLDCSWAAIRIDARQQQAAAAQALAEAEASAHRTLNGPTHRVLVCEQLVVDDALIVFCTARASRMAVGETRGPQWLRARTRSWARGWVLLGRTWQHL